MAKSKLPKRKKIKEKKEIVWKIHDRGWTAEIIKSEEGDGWAVTMTRDGDTEPAYMGPWTMGRNKIDPKPMDQHAFNTWVKSATEFLARAQYQVRTSDRIALTAYAESGQKYNVIFDIDRGDYESEGVLIAEDIYGAEIARVNVDPRFKLTVSAAEDWINTDFAPPPPLEESEHVPEDEDDVWDPDANSGEDFEEEVYIADETQVSSYEEPVFEYD